MAKWSLNEAKLDLEYELKQKFVPNDHMIHVPLISLLLVVDRHKLTVFYLKSFDMDSVQVLVRCSGVVLHAGLQES